MYNPTTHKIVPEAGFLLAIIISISMSVFPDSLVSQIKCHMLVSIVQVNVNPYDFRQKYKDLQVQKFQVPTS